MAAPMITVAERIALHIQPFSHTIDDFEVPLAVTQDGIAPALGVSRAHASIECRRLIEQGNVTVDIRHIIGHPQKRKVYFLTPAGHALVANVKRRVAYMDKPLEQVIASPQNKYIEKRCAEARITDLEEQVRELRGIIARIEGRV